MNIDEIQNNLKNIFQEKKKRIIFWYDGEKEFEESLPSIRLDNVKIVRLDQTSALKLKIELECFNPEDKYVIYAPFHEPAPENDWLFDIRLYSYTFHADMISIILQELNLHDLSLQTYLKKRRNFFNNKDRFNRLKKWVNSDDKDDDIDLKMLAVITRSEHPDLFSIVMKLFEAYSDNNLFDELILSSYWSEIEKLELAPSFWKFVAQIFGYVSEKEPIL